MQRGFLILTLALLFFTLPFAMTTSAEQIEREAALFIRNALDASSPFGYWHGSKTESPTIFFYMEHQAWHRGSTVMRDASTKLLSCVANLLIISLKHEAGSISTTSGHPYRYRVLLNPLPPGGGTQLAAEGLAEPGTCPKGGKQDLILRLLMSKSNPYTF
jgi:hypothetical protein